MCSCDPGLMNDDVARFRQQIVVELPMESTSRKARLANGLSSTVCIDPCILDDINKLWSEGIETMGCCCGHNIMQGWVNIDPKDHPKMFALGYKMRPVDEHGHGQNTFYL